MWLRAAECFCLLYICVFHGRRHGERRGVEHILASGNSIFAASPLCLNSWAQLGLNGYFQSFVQFLDKSPPVCKSTSNVLTCILANIHVPVLLD